MRMLAAVLLLTAPAFAQVAPAPRDAADRLATAVLSREQTIALRLPRFEEEYADRLTDDRRIATLEARHPGLTKAVAATAREVATEGYGRAIDRLREDVAKLYRSRFAATELATLLAFFSTPTGQALVMLSAGSSGDTASQFEADRRARLLAQLQNPDEQTKADLTRLTQSGLMPKVQAINPEISALSTRRFDDVSAFIETALPGRVDATVATFTRNTAP